MCCEAEKLNLEFEFPWKDVASREGKELEEVNFYLDVISQNVTLYHR